jgi:hypothetical protein
MIDANSQFFAILTKVGRAKQANADALGIPWKITEMGVGDANETDPIPSELQTHLINEWRRRPLNQLRVDPANTAVIIAEQIIPADEGGHWIREIGLYDADGDLVAVANCAPSFKPVLSQGSGRTQVVRMNFIVSSTGNITLKIDPSVVLATREYVDNKILEELYKLDNKQSVRVATTANIALAGLQVLDGVTLLAGDRVLVKNQAVAKDNGIYIAGAPAWVRAPDADTNAEVTSALLVSVEQGTALADTRWQLVTDGVIVLGTTPLTFQNVTQGFAPINSPALISPTANTPAQFDSSQLLINSAFLKRVGVEYSNLNSVGVSTVLTSSSIGSVVSATSETPINVTLPPTAGVPLGATLEVANAGGGGAVTVLASGGDVLTAQNGVVVPIVLGAGDSAYFIKVTGEWRLRGGSIALKYSAVMSGPNWVTPPQFANDKSFATAEFVQREKGGFSNSVSIGGGAVALTAAHVGTRIEMSAPGTLTLPKASTFPKGSAIMITTSSMAGAVNLALLAGDSLAINNVSVVAPYAMSSGSDILLISDGALWRAHASLECLRTSPLFSGFFSSNGYQKLPSGLILQWGSYQCGINSTNTLALPVAFPNNFFHGYTTITDNVANVGSYPIATLLPLSLSTFSLRSYYTSSTIHVSWFAVGN